MKALNETLEHDRVALCGPVHAKRALMAILCAGVRPRAAWSGEASG